MRHRSDGFTLIELLVVIVIIGIVLAFATLALRTDTRAEQVTREAQRLVRLIELAGDEAILQGVPIGVELAPHSYRFLVFSNGVWAPMSGDEILRERTLGEETKLELYMDGLPVSLEQEREKPKEGEDEMGLTPHIYLLQTGERVPAQVRLVYEDEEFHRSALRVDVPLLGRPSIEMELM